MPARTQEPLVASPAAVPSSGTAPEGWVVATLPILTEINPPKPPATLLPPQTPVTFVPMAAVDERSGTISEPQVRPFSKARNGYTAFQNGDVIFAKITPCMENGKAAIVRNLSNGLGFGSTEFHVLRSRGGILPEYLYHYIRQENFRRSAEAEMTGTVGQKRVPRGFLENAEIPLPPLAEQKRIVGALESLLGKVASSRDRLERTPAILERYRQAVLAAAVSGRLTVRWREEHSAVEPAIALLERIRARRESRGVHGQHPTARVDPSQEDSLKDGYPDTWAPCRVEDIATVRLGGTPSRKEPRFWNGSVRWVSSGEVANCRITQTREKITEAGLDNSNAKVYPEGTVLIAMIGEGKTRGQSAILDIEACTNQNVAGLVFEDQNVLPEYIWCWALSQYERTRGAGRGGNQPALNGQKVRELWLALPPLEEQVEIVQRVSVLTSLAGRIQERVTTSARAAEVLTQSVLAKAFRGELVPTEAELASKEGRSFESAKDLLERLGNRQERADQVPAPSRRSEPKDIRRRRAARSV
jgi:type I restriction enzyme S subunit